jgi:magnesium-protoporphyrin O-methyltransferase
MTTIKEHCCGADLFFDPKQAAKEYKKYLKKGPSRVTAKLIQQLMSHSLSSKSLVDVGGGIGAIQWWFLGNGGKSTSDIDASSGYLNQAKQHAEENGWGNKTEFLLGNCIDLYSQIGTTEIVTLDKVICCYPNFKEIIGASCEKATEAVSLSYPMDGFISSTLRSIMDFFMSFQKNPFRPFIHPINEIRQTFTQNGFIRASHDLAFPWHIETYVRNL